MSVHLRVYFKLLFRTCNYVLHSCIWGNFPPQRNCRHYFMHVSCLTHLSSGYLFHLKLVFIWQTNIAIGKLNTTSLAKNLMCNPCKNLVIFNPSSPLSTFVHIWLTPSPHADVRICIHNHTAATFIQVKGYAAAAAYSQQHLSMPVGRESLEMDGF